MPMKLPSLPINAKSIARHSPRRELNKFKLFGLAVVLNKLL